MRPKKRPREIRDRILTRPKSTRRSFVMKDAEKIRKLNDLARLKINNCLIITSDGVDDLDSYDIIMQSIATYDFTEHKDPDDLHDFGVVWVEDQAVFWDIQCFEKDLRTPAVDPSNTATTARVLSIMLDEEYFHCDRPKKTCLH